MKLIRNRYAWLSHLNKAIYTYKTQLRPIGINNSKIKITRCIICPKCKCPAIARYNDFYSGNLYQVIDASRISIDNEGYLTYNNHRMYCGS